MDLTVAQSASSLKPGAAPIILLKSEIGVPQLAKKLNQVVKHFSHRDALFIDILIARLFSSLLSSPFLVSVLAQSGL
ncbi:hypothetical protein FCM35_KLT17363 [Carex littledalei]|uniref:Uncharacterized protein n=1 Tax=Carex littledalei TaxID=544730 RepID=A0A833RME1_9POAL|nr:hypothetical protein FCM35_KLT17363 [Carex littledalei]